tara:strand:- start:4964 stop:5737 length:774 start_codon:yes stop_codon:yes gene_type:complete
MEKEFKKFLDNFPIEKSQILYVSSDILNILIYHKYKNINFNANYFIDYLFDRIGNLGTLLFPTFSWDFCKGKNFDYKNTQSETGSLSKIALKRKDFIRTKHPIYSFTVKGKDAEKLFELDDQSGWGPDSIFAYFHKNSAKNFFIGIDYKLGFTFDHYFEEKVGVDYRYFKNFENFYIDHNGIKTKKIYKMYVRDLTLNIETAISDKMDYELISNNAYFKKSFQNINFGIIDMKVAGDIMENDIRNKGNLIYAREFNG